MATYYFVHGKKAHATPLDEGKFNTKEESFYNSNGIKEQILKNCDIKPELLAISRSALPSPKYRASVAKYLKKFFSAGRLPSYEIIDYSDYKGTIRSFPPIRDPEEEEYATGYEKKMGFIEYHDFEDITRYDEELGFIFSVGKRGMLLQFLGTGRPNLSSRSMFQICKDGIAFNFEPGLEEDERPAVDLRSYKTDGEIPPKLTGSFYSVMLLNFLLR